MPTRPSPGRARPIVLLLAALIALAPADALAVASGGESQRAPSSDKDYAAGKRAFAFEDWELVVESMQKVVARRPWHDNAHTYLGFAYRRLGDYDRSLAHYHKALDHNPNHRGALEYLGEAYLELGQPDRTKEVLDRLQAVCKRMTVGFSNGGWKSGCEEWVQLKQVYEHYLETGQVMVRYP